MKGLLRYLSITILVFSACYLGAAEQGDNETSIATEQYTFSENPASQDPVKIELLHEEESVQPGRPFWVLIRFEIEKGWHTYWKDPADSGKAAKIDWKLPEGFKVGNLHWPSPQKLDLGSSVEFGYEDEMLLLAEITPPEKLAEQKVDIGAEVRWLVCSDTTCMPGTTDITAHMNVGHTSPQPKNEWSEHFTKARAGLPEANQDVPSANDFEGGFFMALLFAFVGGMILNLMPCVLPVISLKIFSFVKMAGQDRSLTLKHGLAFALGVIVSFWALAGALLALQAYGNSVGWGFQLQEPIFVAILAAVIFVLGLSLFGVMELGTGLTSLAGNVSHKTEGFTSSFLSGILATAVATPCTGPFLGSAVGFAVTLSPVLSLLIFTTLGIGMAFPYLLLSAYPSLLRFIPKPGNWMITFKEIMGFIMMATTLWLLWVFGAQTNTLAVTILLGSLFFLSIGSWIYGKWGSPMRKKSTRYIGYVFATAALIVAMYALKASTSEEVAAMGGTAQTEHVADEWEPFSPERVAELRKQGIPVFVDFTAKWCLICQANHLVLSGDHVSDTFKDKKVVRMKADWTKSDPVITAELKKFGRNSVPLYVLYGAEESEQPKILPQVLTPDVVLEHLSGLDEQIADIK